MRAGEDGIDAALTCAEGVEDLLKEVTPSGQDLSNTRFHRILATPWPTFRLLDVFVRLYPENGATRMGGCKPYENWRGDPDVWDWPRYKRLFTPAMDGAISDPNKFELWPEDGPLTVQHHRRWLRLYTLPGYKAAA